MRTKFVLFILFLGLSIFQIQAQDPHNRAVEVSATVQNNPPQINFSWVYDWSGPSYTIYKKLPTEATWGEPIANLHFQATEWTDTDVESGVAYEYAFFKKHWERIEETVIVAAGTELNFTIKNIYGDGLCCNFGHGSYEVRSCAVLQAAGSDFGEEASTTFTACDAVKIMINPDMQTNNTYWELKDNMTGELVADSGGQGQLLADRPKYGFIYTGIAIPPIENRGTILLLIDDILTAPLEIEIQQLEEDLIGDGWKVLKQNIQQSEEVTAVRTKIQTVYQNTPDLEALFLLGHIPVPYSGSFYADGHIENHWGAWPADVYYGELDGVWTDETVTNTTAFLTANHNLPGDGKFDQSAIPSKVELQVGRVDMHAMDDFGSNEIELTRQYLHKNHAWKRGQVPMERRALVDDNLNIVLASPAASAWRNFAPMLGHENVEAIDFFSSMQTESYLWAYGCGSGSHVSCNGVGTTEDFANNELKNIFTMLLGSQFGDWNNSNNFLRAPLASGQTLTSAWVGNPPWTVHHMAMGYPIGYSTKITQNSDTTNYYPGPQLVHVSLMGDPSIRMHPVLPPQDMEILLDDNTVTISWNAPNETDILGYHIYQADSLRGEFTRLNQDIIIDNFYTETLPTGGEKIYMVRTVKLETSGSGTYQNMSLGVIDAVSVPLSLATKKAEKENFIHVFPNPAQDYLHLSLDIDISQHLHLKILQVDGQVVQEQQLNSTDLQTFKINISELPSGIYILRLEGEQINLFKKIIVVNSL